MLAEQMLTCILVDAKTHFRSCLAKPIVYMNKEGVPDRKASREECITLPAKHLQEGGKKFQGTWPKC